MMKTGMIQFIALSLVLLTSQGYTNEDSGKTPLIDFRDPSAVRKQHPVLIAHRGGVITAQSPECSMA
ncbi:MAG: hypothetical protein HQ515_26315, partial [Phycisphaeraceae bacterium]|nr:hypothetical protein [Phycisphaeraceae bacterium]